MHIDMYMYSMYMHTSMYICTHTSMYEQTLVCIYAHTSMHI